MEEIKKQIKNNDEPLRIILDKSWGERFLEWSKLIFKVALYGLFVFLFFWSYFQTLEKNAIKPWDIESYYVWKNEEHVIPKEWEEWVAWIEVNWTIWNNSMSDWMYGTIVASETIIQMLDNAQKDNEIKKVILEINSPWWTVLDSEKISKKINEVKAQKEVYALMEAVAASGWYYIASQCDKIFAYNETITWSIWVIIQLPNFEELMDKIWVKYFEVTTWEFKSMWSPFSEMSPWAMAIFKDMADESYETFINRIIEWRWMERVNLLELADWRIYTWKQAFKNWLVDSNEWKQWILKSLNEEYWEYNIILYWTKKSPFEELFAPMWRAMNKFLWKASMDQRAQLMYIMN